MKIVVTGSLGYVSKPLTQKLLRNGHDVTVISSTYSRGEEISNCGANPAIGNMEDLNFISRTFDGADAVFCMLAPYGNFSDPKNDSDRILDRAQRIAQNYSKAITNSGATTVVYLSSIGADMKSGSGLIRVHSIGEYELSQLSHSIRIAFLRPAGYYKNLYLYADSIRNQNTIAANYGQDDRVVWVSNIDIADAIVSELESGGPGQHVRYVASDELRCSETAKILGNAIGNPGLTWNRIGDLEQLQALRFHGMNESIARSFVEMNASIRNGTFYADYDRNKPILGKVKMSNFSEDFAAFYAQNEQIGKDS